MRTRALQLALACLPMICGCSTQRFASEQSALVVAECIRMKWQQSGAPGFAVPIVMNEQADGYFVGFPSLGGLYTLPSGRKHPGYPVWAEVTDTESGSVTVYHRAYQIFHGRIDRAVCDCQEASD